MDVVVEKSTLLPDRYSRFVSSPPVAARSQTLELKSHISQCKLSSLFFPFALVVSHGGKGESGGRLSHGCSGRLPPCSVHPDEDLLGPGATQETHLPQAERETGAGDELTPSSGPASTHMDGIGHGSGWTHTQHTVEPDWIFLGHCKDVQTWSAGRCCPSAPTESPEQRVCPTSAVEPQELFERHLLVTESRSWHKCISQIGRSAILICILRFIQDLITDQSNLLVAICHGHMA